MMIFLNMISFEHLLTPIAIVLRHRPDGNKSFIPYRTAHIFGVRVAYWTVTYDK